MNWWALYGDDIGKGFAGVIIAGLGSAALWLGQRNTKALRAADAKPAPPAPPPPPPALPPPAAAAVPPITLTHAVSFDEATSLKIQLSRAMIELDGLGAALARVRREAEEDLRRQRRSIDELEAELRKSAAALIEERERLKALHAENAELRRQIAGRPEPHGPSPTAPRPRSTEHAGGYRDYAGVRSAGDHRAGVRPQSDQGVRRNDRDQGR